MAFLIALAALVVVALLLAALTRIEDLLLQDPLVREASRPAPLTPRAAAVRVAAPAHPTTPALTPTPTPALTVPSS